MIIINVVSASTTSVRIEWKSPSVTNGVVTSYTLYISTMYSDQNHSFVRMVGPTYQYLLMDLSPYQLVDVRILATTGGGNGPLSQHVYGRTNSMLITSRGVFT